VAYSAGSLAGPSVASYKISPLDSAETELSVGQEVASPVLTIAHSPGSYFTDAIEVMMPVNSRISEWYTAKQEAEALDALMLQRRAHQEHEDDTNLKDKTLSRHEMFKGTGEDILRNKQMTLSRDRRAALNGTTWYTQLLLHWFNSETLSWKPVQGRATPGKTVSNLPEDVLNNPAFSGKVANLLVTTTEALELPECSQFQDLVAGQMALGVHVFYFKQVTAPTCKFAGETVHVIVKYKAYLCVYIYVYMFMFYVFGVADQVCISMCICKLNRPSRNHQLRRCRDTLERSINTWILEAQSRLGLCCGCVVYIVIVNLRNERS
jgi:hypothetical protein